MKILIIAMVVQLSLAAASLNLEQLLYSAQDNHPDFTATQEMMKAEHARHEASYSRAPVELLSSVAYATPASAQESLEYSIGLGSEFRLGDSAKDASSASHYEHLAMQNSAKLKLLKRQNELQREYHLSCIERESIDSYANVLEQFELVYAKKTLAFEYGELSKKEMLLLRLQRDKLIQKVEALRLNEDILRKKVLSLAQLDSDNQLFCDDLAAIEIFDVKNLKIYNFSEQMFANLELSLKSKMRRYGSNFNSIYLSAHYDNEVDIERFGVELSVPLNFTSSKYEKMRVSLLHDTNRVHYEREALYLKKRVHTQALLAELSRSVKLYGDIKNRVNLYENELMPLMLQSYRLNESSFVEYLLSFAAFNDIVQELYSAKRGYYQTLFELYNVLEIKERS